MILFNEIINIKNINLNIILVIMDNEWKMTKIITLAEYVVVNKIFF